jgi:hypothetical protein
MTCGFPEKLFLTWRQSHNNCNKSITRTLSVGLKHGMPFGNQFQKFTWQEHHGSSGNQPLNSIELQQ